MAERARDRAHEHLRYIRELWNAVTAAAADGLDLDRIQELCSLEGNFAFVKEMRNWDAERDGWYRMQRRSHVRLFFLQHRNPAAEILEDSAPDDLAAASERVRKLRAEGGASTSRRCRSTSSATGCCKRAGRTPPSPSSGWKRRCTRNRIRPADGWRI